MTEAAISNEKKVTLANILAEAVANLPPVDPIRAIDLEKLGYYFINLSPTYQPSRGERLSAPVRESWRRLKGAWSVLTTGEEWY